MAFWLALACGTLAHPREPEFLRYAIGNGSTLETYLKLVRETFVQLDFDENGIADSDDLKHLGVMTAARDRATIAVELMIYDLDGDGAVTTEEIRRSLRFQRRPQPPYPAFAPFRALREPPAGNVDAYIAAVFAADTDKDGRITFAEALGFARTHVESDTEATRIAADWRLILNSLVPGKSSATRAEFEEAARMLFRSADTDGDDKISNEEAAIYHRKMVPRKAE